MIRKYHNHKLQTTLWHRKEEPLNHHETPGRQIKQSNQLSLPHQDLEDFWNIESIGVHDNPRMSNDEMVMRNFKETITFENGSYQVPWPWKDIPPD